VSRRLWLGLYVGALIVRLLLAWLVKTPSYYDAWYYQDAALGLVGGDGLTDHVIWNYLDDPQGLPRPACLYWLPMNA
jgi:hypothetical protein